MSQVAPAVSTGAPSIGTALLRGRVAARRSISTKNGRQYVTIVKLPAPDEFTSPQTVELRSTRLLAEIGEMVSVKVQIGGYGRTYQTTNQETGEKVNVQTADNSLTVVE